MPQTIWDILTDHPFEFSTMGMRRVAYLNSYSWAVITRWDGIQLYRSADKGQTWIFKGTILSHTSTLTSISCSIHAIPVSNLFYWVAHIYETGGSHSLYVGRVDVTNVDSPTIDVAIDVSSQTSTTGCYIPDITYSGGGCFYLSYMTNKAGISPYHQYYTLMSNDYTNWAGTVELNIGSTTQVGGRIALIRRRGIGMIGVCTVYGKGTTLYYRYNTNGNANGAGDWTAEAQMSAATYTATPNPQWLRYNYISLASRSNGEVWCCHTASSYVGIYGTSTFSGTWTLKSSSESLTSTRATTLTIRDYGNDELTDELAVAIYYDTNEARIFSCVIEEEEGTQTQHVIGSGKIVAWVSSPEYVEYRPGGLPILFMEKEPNMGVYSGTWTSDVRESTGALTWSGMSIQNEGFPDSGHGAGQAYYVETRTGPANPPSGAWTAATEIAPYTYQINSLVNNYIQIRITYSTDPTLHDSLIPLTSVDNGSPLPIEIQYTISGRVEPVALMWYMRYAIPRYETY